jgi:WD40 repeat protein
MSTEQPINIFASGFKFIKEIAHPNEEFFNLEWSPDGKILALGPRSGSYTLWYQKTSEFEYRALGAFAGPQIIRWSPDGKKLAIACTSDGIIEIQTLANPIVDLDKWYVWRTEFNTFPPYSDDKSEGAIHDIKWSSNGTQLITAHKKNTGRHDVIMWNVEKAEVMQRFQVHSGRTNVEIAVSPDGNFITSNDDEMLRIRATSDFENIIAEIKPNWEWFDIAEITRIDWSTNGKLIAIADWSDNIHIVDTQSWECIHKIKAPQEGIRTLKFSPNSRFLAATGADNIFRLWNCDNWKLRIQVPDLTDGFSGKISFHPNQPIIAIATLANGKVKLWEYQPNLLS